MHDGVSPQPIVREPTITTEASQPDPTVSDLADRARPAAAGRVADPRIAARLEPVVQAAGAIPAARWVAVSAADPPGLRNLAGSDHRAVILDRLQDVLGQGPSLDALAEGRPVRSADLAVDRRWPDFAPRAARFGIVAVLAGASDPADDPRVSVTCYAGRTDGFDDDAAAAVEALARLGATVLGDDGMVERLRSTLRSRDVIGQATGMLMQRFAISSDEAFRLLVDASQRTNRKLSAIAEELTTTGRLPRGIRPPGRRPG